MGNTLDRVQHPSGFSLKGIKSIAQRQATLGETPWVGASRMVRPVRAKVKISYASITNQNLSAYCFSHKKR